MAQNPTQRRVLDVTGELNRLRQSHAQVHGGSHEGSSRPQRRAYQGDAQLAYLRAKARVPARRRRRSVARSSS